MLTRARAMDALVVAVALAAVAVGARGRCPQTAGRVLGVALGMSAAEARAAFAPGAAGRFRTGTSEASPSLEWRADVERPGAPASAALELHEGKLARVRLRFAASGAPAEVSGLLGARAVEAAAWSRDGDGRIVATWDARCEGRSE